MASDADQRIKNLELQCGLLSDRLLSIESYLNDLDDFCGELAAAADAMKKKPDPDKAAR